jgi:hypothetical protein
MHRPTLFTVSGALPPALHAVEEVIQFTDMHGLGFGPMVKGHPAIVTVSALVHTVEPATTAVCDGTMVP